MSERFIKRNKILKNLRIKRNYTMSRLFSQWQRFDSFKDYMKLIKIALAITVSAMLTLPLCAVEIPLISKETIIPRNERLSLGFGTVPQLNTTALLEITARIIPVE